MPSKLVVDLIKLPQDERIEISAELDPKKLEMEFHDFRYKDKLAIHGSAEKSAEILFFNGTITAAVEKICSRCSEEVTQNVKEPFEFTLDIKGKTEVDVTGELREIMIFSHPLSFLCKEDCKGLCAECGANLNTETCKCKK